MALNRPRIMARQVSSSVTLVECQVRVSPVLARLIRKAAEREATGLPAKDALLAAADVRPGQLQDLRQQLEDSAEQLEECHVDIGQLQTEIERSESSLVEIGKEKGVLREQLLDATSLLAAAQKQISGLQDRLAVLSAEIEGRDERLAWSLHLAGVTEAEAGFLTELRDRFAVVHPKLPDREREAVIGNLGQEEVARVAVLLACPGWRLLLVRWLLRLFGKHKGNFPE